MNRPTLSVIICAHNPRTDYLRRVLAALQEQTLPRERWELLLVDNVSQSPLASAWDLSWHPLARHVREEQLGLTPARLRGIVESAAETLVFVDDDNVLREDFLARAAEIADQFPFLGAWGGNVIGEFEQPVPEWARPHLHALALREVKQDAWSNYNIDNRSFPFGAGLCVRKPVAAAYAHALAARPASVGLDRKGASMISAGDVDLVLTAYDAGYGTGMFERLHVTHLIPKARLTVDYLCRLLEGIEYSTHLLRNHRNPGYVPSQDSKLVRWLRLYRVWRLPEPVKSFAKAQDRGIAKAWLELTAKS
jgi:glycosyltransferase involved in cell wall biosynthesis